MTEDTNMKKEFGQQYIEILPENIGDMPASDAAPLLERAANRTEVLGWAGQFADGLRQNLRGAAAWINAIVPELSKKTLSSIATASFVAVSLAACANRQSIPQVFTETSEGVTQTSPAPVPPTETATITAPAIRTLTSTETATLIPTERQPLTNPKILLLGDSMFAATYVPADLSELFKKSEIEVDFIGDKTDAGGHIPIDGFSGFDTATILNQLQSTSWEAGGITYANTISEHVPDIVVIQLGTNDLGIFKDPAAEYVSDISSIINFLRSKNSNVYIEISTLIPSRNAASDVKIKLINADIVDFVQSVNLPGSPVVATPDLRGEWQPDDFFDDFHPNAAGSEKMAKNVFDTMLENNFVAVNSEATP